MRAIPIKCPNCGASLNAASTAQTVTCAYCQTTSRVRPRTAFFEAPIKLPEAPPHLASMPIAVQQHSRRWAVGCSVTIAVFVGLMALIPIVIATKVRQAATGHNGTTGRALIWGSSTPLAADVNGDGIADLVGRLQGLDDIKSIHVVAFDGTSGKRLWQSEKLGSHEETHSGTLTLLGDHLLFVSDRGLARAYSTKDGSARWKVNIAEKLKLACRAGSVVYLVTADEKWITVDAESGKATEARAPASCQALPNDSSRQGPTNVIAFDWTDQSRPKPRELDGMAINIHAIVEGKHRLAFGYKAPGTQVPMVARYSVENFNPPGELDRLDLPLEDLPPKARRELRKRQWEIERALRKSIDDAEFEEAWKTQVPSRDPLGASSSRIDHYGLSLESDCVVIPYEVRNKPIHVACLSYKTGEHRWDVVLPKAFIDRIYGITVSPKRAFVSISSRVDALDLATGKRLFTVGQTPK